MKSIFKIDFNTNTNIVLAVLESFRGHKTNFKYQMTNGSYKYWSFHRILTTVAVDVALVDRKVLITTDNTDPIIYCHFLSYFYAARDIYYTN